MSYAFPVRAVRAARRQQIAVRRCQVLCWTLQARGGGIGAPDGVEVRF